MAKRKERLVYKGTIFKVYQWKQKMFDGSYKMFERIERPASVQILPVSGNRIATTMESQPARGSFAGLVGGRVDEGESPLQAAKRELLEEAGMEARRWKMLKTFSPSSKKLKWDTYLFAAVGCRKVADQTLDEGERIRIKSITLGELLTWRNEKERIGPDIALYFTEMHYNPRARRRFARELGIRS